MSAFAGEPKATLCQKEAVKGAVALFAINNGKGSVKTSTELIQMDHSEGGSEVWDVKIQKGTLNYSPYRMTVIIDGCIITGFEMPFAG